jgi:hypothetical protein
MFSLRISRLIIYLFVYLYYPLQHGYEYLLHIEIKFLNPIKRFIPSEAAHY